MTYNHIVEISTDTKDALFQDILIQDYRGLVESISEFEDNLENLKPYEFEDLVAWRRYRDAIAITMEYYLSSDKRKAVLNEAANRK